MWTLLGLRQYPCGLYAVRKKRLLVKNNGHTGQYCVCIHGSWDMVSHRSEQGNLPTFEVA